jgi:sodium-dependent dicarboxylate transporter 2/3/5
MVAAAPICLSMFFVLCLILLLLNRPEIKQLSGVEEYIDDERAKLGRLSRKEKNTLIVFATAVTLWIVPGVVGIVAGDDSATYEELTNSLDEGIVAILAASLLFLLPVNWARREFTFTWSEAKDIDWGTVILFGSGIIFGTLLQDTGLAETIGNWGADTFGVSSEISITIFAIVLAILISETTSNTASATIVVPIVIPVAMAAQVDPFVPALAATFAASFGFMLPVSTPQNAIVYGSGVVPITQMVRNGFSFDIIGALLILAGVPLMVSVLGIGG